MADHPAKPASRTATLLAALMLASGILMGVYLLVSHEIFPRTDDAFVHANFIGVSPRIPGRIATVQVEEGALVNKGDILFTLDPADARLAVEEARAQVDALEAALKEADRRRLAAEAEEKAAAANVKRMQAKQQLAADTRNRMQAMVDRQFISQEKFEKIDSDVAQADAGVEMALREQEAATLAVPSTASLRSELQAARTALAEAQLTLDRTTVRAPFTGRIVDCDLLPGRVVAPAEPLFTLIDTSRWFVIANFREGDLRKIQPGSKATVKLLTEPGRSYQGTVTATGYAVQTRDRIDLLSLPYVRKDLDWVKLAQRFPVRILIDQPEPPEAFRIGASALVALDGG